MINVLICLVFLIYLDKAKSNPNDAKEKKYLTTNFTIRGQQPYIDVSIGFPGTQLTMHVSQDINFSYITNDKYSLGKQSSFTSIKKEKIDIYGMMISSELISDLFAVRSEEILSYSFLYFYLITNYAFSDEYKQSALSLAYEFNHNNYSLVHNFLQDKYIDKAQFTIYLESLYSQKGKIIFGKPPINLTLNKYISKCKVIQKHNNKWNCKLDKITFIHNKTLSYIIHPEKESSFFSIDDNIILAPYDFLKYLKKYIFYSYIDDNTCFYRIIDNLHSFHCDCRFIQDFPEIIFHFGKYEFALNKRDLFEETGIYRCNFNIVGENKKYWKIGRLFLMKYISTWDYEKSEIRFYNDEPFGENNLETEIEIKENKKIENSSVKIMKLFCGFLLINIFILLYTKIIFNKNIIVPTI